MYVGKNDFEPRPNVDSIVLDFSLTKDKYSLDYYFFEIIKECLKNRRKTLLNTLPVENKEKLLDILTKMNLKPTCRIEEIGISTMVDLVNEIKKI